MSQYNTYVPAASTLAAVLACLAEYAGMVDGFCHASNRVIADRLELTGRTVRAAVAALARQKAITVVTLPHPRGTERRIYIDVERYDDMDRELRSGATGIPERQPWRVYEIVDAETGEVRCGFGQDGFDAWDASPITGNVTALGGRLRT